MAAFLFLLSLLTVIASFAIAAPLSDLLPALPGQPAASFRQFSGYLTVDQQAGRRLFYYLVESQSSPRSSPLALWLNGGPGCSSIGIGGFTENGPFRVSSNTDELIDNPYAWNTVSNVLYVDSPAGVGWSYSNNTADYKTSDTNTARDNFMFLLQWFSAFPEFKENEFFILGESYAGHYAPQLAAMVVDYNRQHSAEGRQDLLINFKGIAIGNPILNGLIDFKEGVLFQRNHGLISDATCSAVTKYCNFSVFSTNSPACATAFAELDREVSDYTSPYDVLQNVCLPSALHQTAVIQRIQRQTKSESPSAVDVCIDDELGLYMNRRDVQLAFHANTTGLPYAWSYCAHGRVSYDESNIDDSMLPVLAHILEAGVRVLVYSGDQDTVLPFSGSRKQVHDLAEQMKLNTTVPYSAWFHEGQVGGWTQTYENLTFATVRGAAHTVPNSSPARALKLFVSFLHGSSMPTYYH